MAGCVQAVATSVSVVVTFALVLITWRYVSLTLRLTRSAEMQVRLQMQEREARRGRVLSNIGTLIGSDLRYSWIFMWSPAS